MPPHAPAIDAAAVDALIRDFPGRISLVIKDLSTGLTYEHEPHRRLPAASVFKLPIMAALLHEVEHGRLSLEDRHAPHDGLSRHGTGSIGRLQADVARTIGEYCHMMIAQSDNVATDLILELIGTEPVNALLDELGLTNTRVNMPIGRWHYLMVGLDDEPINAHHDALCDERVQDGRFNFDAVTFCDSLANNVSSASDMARMLEMIHRGRLISADASQRMRDMLLACTHRGMIPRQLDPAVQVAHKIGQSARIRADVGIVYLPHRPVIISALTCAPEPGQARPGRQLITDIAAATVRNLHPPAVTNADRTDPV